MTPLRQRIAKWFAPDLYSKDAVREVVKDEIHKARMALPITANYDPNGEGYRPLMGRTSQRRDVQHVDLDRMYEVAYFMWDTSAMTRRLALMDQSFLFAEPITVTSPDPDVQTVIDNFMTENKLGTRFPDKMMWMGLLGEQCWPVTVLPQNGLVLLEYVDPQSIKEVYVNSLNVEETQQVELQGVGGRTGRKMAVIRKDWNIHSKGFGRLLGECFFFSINHPPNDPRGRSDYLTLFDWIDGLERHGFNYLERAEFIFNFVWDVLLEGMTEEEIKSWLANNRTPDPGSIRAHNERVKWEAVVPNFGSHDFAKGFDSMKGFVMGSAGRPASWYGEGGKAYQNEAEQFGQVPIKDLEKRNELHKEILNEMVQFQLDQAVIAKRLSEEKAKAGFDVNMPKISEKDLSRLINGVPQLASALAVAETQKWVSHETAVSIFAIVISRLGVDVNVEDELKKAKGKPEEDTKDYE
jgi:hypothetical protein